MPDYGLPYDINSLSHYGFIKGFLWPLSIYDYKNLITRPYAGYMGQED